MCASAPYLITPTAQAQFDDAFIRAVDQNAPGGPGDPGTTWLNAYTDLQDALDEAGEFGSPVTEIWVAAASEPYVPSVFFPQFFSELFFLIDGVSIYGGFLGDAPGGGETELSQRNPEMNETILSGDLNGDDDNATSSCCSIHSGPGCDDTECQSAVCLFEPSCCEVDWDTLCAGLAGSLCGGLCNTGDNAAHVVVALDVGDTTALNGFTLSRAFTHTTGPQTSGGGMIIVFASPKIVRTRFTENFATDGGGLFVVGNSCSPAEPTLVNFSFIGNSALNVGGGIFIDRFGGLPDVQFVNGVFSGNSAGQGGGALWAFFVDGTLTLVNSTLSGNSVVAGEGGGVAISAGGSGSAILTNAILWGNTPDQIDAQPATTVVSFSDVEGGLPADVIDGGGNIDADPMFCNVAGGNLRLQDGSPCIDTGDDGAVPQDLADVDDDGNTGETLPWDLDTRSRQFDGNAGGTLVDMGAYENQHDQLCPADLDGDCSVGASDLLLLLASWGPCPGCAADLDCNLVVGASDLLSLLASWGLCACGTGPEPLTLQEELDDACLTWDDWNAFVAVMTDPNAPQVKKDRYHCWMTHYLFHCNKCFCTHSSECPNPDPFN